MKIYVSGEYYDINMNTMRVWGFGPQLIFGCGWYALLLTHTVHTQLALCKICGGVP
jgi:hypothetical protein